MPNRNSRSKEWLRSLGAGAAATLIVGAILYSMSNQKAPDRLAVKSSAPTAKSTDNLAGDRARGVIGKSVAPIKTKSEKLRSSRVAGLTKSRRKVADRVPGDTDAAQSGQNMRVADLETSEATTVSGVVGLPRPTESGFGDGARAQSSDMSKAHAPGKVSALPIKVVGAAERKKLEASWHRKLTDIHKGFHVKGSDSVRRNAGNKAEAEVDAINDPLAVQAVWKVLSGNAEHHQIVARTLARLEASASTKMLAALSVYSPDEKARRAAANALVIRNPIDFVEPLISVFNRPLSSRVDWIDLPEQGRARVLLIEGERVNYQFLYPAPAGPENEPRGVYSFDRPYVPRQEAEEFNRQQLEMAHAVTDQQIKSDQEQLGRLNERIAMMSERALAVLRQATKTYVALDREAWRRWLADRQGYPYVPPKEIPKPTIAQVVPPAYTPTFVPVPIPT
jgi:hypothetical protein